MHKLFRQPLYLKLYFMEKLISFIRNKVELPDEQLNSICSKFKHQVIPKNRFVIQKGQIVSHYYFIESGGFIIYAKEHGVQHTRYFAFENEFIADIARIKTHERSQEYIQTLEETSLYLISHEDMEALYVQYPVWQTFGRLVWEESFCNVLKSIHQFQTLTAKERYLELVKRSNLINRVPLKDLSLFLGITPSSLSRIRKEITL